jgi:hypothetical protein
MTRVAFTMGAGDTTAAAPLSVAPPAAGIHACAS